MTVYIDSYLALNFVLCYLQLLLTKRIYNKKTNTGRIVIGSISGALYSLTIFIKNLEFFKYIAPVIIIAFVFKYNSFIDFVRTVVVFYIVVFAFGGCIYAISNSMFLLSASVSYLGLWLLGSFYKKIMVKENLIVNVKLIVNKEEITLKGLIDTGNTLIDPYTNLPVIIISMDGLNFDMLLLRLIPYKSVGNDNGILKVFTPEKAFVNDEEVSCAVGIYDSKLSNDNTYNAILNPVMF